MVAKIQKQSNIGVLVSLPDIMFIYHPFEVLISVVL